jgi:hypothetical protein
MIGDLHVISNASMTPLQDSIEDLHPLTAMYVV